MTPEEIQAMIDKAKASDETVKTPDTVSDPPTDFTPRESDSPIETKTEEPVGEYIPAITDSKVITLSRKEQILSEMADIERESKGFSNIPLNSNYWELRKELQLLQ